MEAVKEIEFSQVSDENLKSALKEILLRIEGQRVSKKTVRNDLEKALKCKINSREKKDRFNQFLIEVNETLDEEEEEESSDEEISVKPKKAKKRKRKEKEKPRKKRKTSHDEDNEEKEFLGLNDSSLKQVRVQTYKGKTQIHIRNYYQKGSEYFPTKRGIALSVDEWDNLRDNVEVIQEMLDNYEG